MTCSSDSSWRDLLYPQSPIFFRSYNNKGKSPYPFIQKTVSWSLLHALRWALTVMIHQPRSEDRGTLASKETSQYHDFLGRWLIVRATTPSAQEACLWHPSAANTPSSAPKNKCRKRVFIGIGTIDCWIFWWSHPWTLREESESRANI